MLNSMQLFVKNTLNNLSSPNLAPLVAYVAPPVYDDLFVQPKAYVWGGELAYEQKTMAGPAQAQIGVTGAFRAFEWRVDVWIKSAIKNTDPAIDQNFPLLVDAVIIKLNSVQTAQQLEDPTTGAKTWLMRLNKGRGTYGNLHASKDQRLWIAEFHLSVELLEWVQQ